MFSARSLEHGFPYIGLLGPAFRDDINALYSGVLFLEFTFGLPFCDALRFCLCSSVLGLSLCVALIFFAPASVNIFLPATLPFNQISCRSNTRLRVSTRLGYEQVDELV
jgi:hypothetical protein